MNNRQVRIPGTLISDEVYRWYIDRQADVYLWVMFVENDVRPGWLVIVDLATGHILRTPKDDFFYPHRSSCKFEGL